MPRKLICPKCGSTDISHDLSSHAIATGRFLSERRCNKCGYTGIFPEIEEKRKSRQ